MNTFRGLFGAIIVRPRGATVANRVYSIFAHSLPPGVTGLERIFQCLNGGSHADRRERGDDVRPDLERRLALSRIVNFNIGDRVSLSIGGWMRQIVAASGHDAELVTVPDDAVPDDLALSRSQPQHMLADTRKATEVPGWQPADAAASIERSVRWHLRHSPPDPSPDFAADDRALAR